MNELIIAPPQELATVPNGGGGDPVLTRPQKAAIVLSIIDPSDAALLLKEFSETTLLNFAKAVSDLKPIQPSTLNDVVLEFLGELGDTTDVRGGVQQVRKFLEAFMEGDDVDRILEDLMGQQNRPVWDRVGDAPSAAAATYLGLEHPQTVAYVLSKLRSDKAAAILERLDREFGQAVVLRMSRVPSLSEHIIGLVSTAIEKDFLSAINRQSGAIKPAELIGNLMNNVSSVAREEFLANLEEADATLAQEVTRVMFTFADIAVRLAPMDVAKIVKEVEEERLLIGLRLAKDTDNPSYDFIISNLSKRLSERLVEDIDAMDPVTEKDGEPAQMEVINIIQKKAKMGEISLYEPEPE